MRKHDYHLIEFVIDDETDEGLKFPKAPHDAMWVVQGHEEPGERTCPDMHSVSNYDVMEPISVSPRRPIEYLVGFVVMAAAAFRSQRQCEQGALGLHNQLREEGRRPIRHKQLRQLGPWREQSEQRKQQCLNE